MAFTNLIPATINGTFRKGGAMKLRSSAVLDFAGAAVNLSTFDSMTAKLVAQSPNPCTADVTFGTATGDANGIISVLIADDALAANPLGTAQLVILGVPVAADDPQLIATGTFQLSDG